MWVSKRMKARQVQVESSDITVAILEVESRAILLFSVYVPPVQHDKNSAGKLVSRLRLIEEIYKVVARDWPEKKLEVFIAGDFNR